MLTYASRQVAEEIKFEPKVSCKVVDESITFKQADLLHGDILLVQRALTEVQVMLDTHDVFAQAPHYLQSCLLTDLHYSLLTMQDIAASLVCINNWHWFVYQSSCDRQTATLFSVLLRLALTWASITPFWHALCTQCLHTYIFGAGTLGRHSITPSLHQAYDHQSLFHSLCCAHYALIIPG